MLVLLDNFDSFTFNLVHIFGELGQEPIVYRNNEKTAAEILSKNPKGIIISPGPCNPDKAGISLQLVVSASVSKVPLLGVCLGHQTIGQAFGGEILSAKQILHGKTDKIHHDGLDLFQDIPSPFIATRYHSLAISKDSLPETLSVTAWTECGEIMGIKHKDFPAYGVQFHPESIATDFGHKLLKNFLLLIEQSNDY